MLRMRALSGAQGGTSFLVPLEMGQVEGRSSFPKYLEAFLRQGRRIMSICSILYATNKAQSISPHLDHLLNLLFLRDD